MSGLEELRFQRGLLADRAAQWAEECAALTAKLRTAEERIKVLEAESVTLRTPSDAPLPVAKRANGADSTFTDG